MLTQHSPADPAPPGRAGTRQGSSGTLCTSFWEGSVLLLLLQGPCGPGELGADSSGITCTHSLLFNRITEPSLSVALSEEWWHLREIKR